MNKKWMLSILLAGLIAVLGACSDSDESANNDKNADSDGNTEEQADVPEPDLDDVPDVVAEVNGESIAKEDFENVYMTQFQKAVMQAQMSQQELNQDDLKDQVVDLLIDQELVIQEAKGKDYKATDEDIDETLDQMAKENELDSKEDFLAALKEQDMDEAEVRKELEKQVIVTQLIDDETGDTEPSDDEVKDFYEQIKKQNEEADSDEEVESLDELKPQIVEHLKDQKKAEAYQTLVEKLKDSADITKNL